MRHWLISRQEVEAECQRYQELFEFAPDGYLVTDRNGKIQEANRSVAKLLVVVAGLARRTETVWVCLESVFSTELECDRPATIGFATR